MKPYSVVLEAELDSPLPDQASILQTTLAAAQHPLPQQLKEEVAVAAVLAAKTSPPADLSFIQSLSPRPSKDIKDTNFFESLMSLVSLLSLMSLLSF